MLPVHKIIWSEWRARTTPIRVLETSGAMENPEQIRAYVKAYQWGGPTSALLLHHLRELSKMIRPGDTVLDLACGPGPLLLELAALYPGCTFVGADLSQPMLDMLMTLANEKGLRNVSVVREDISVLSSTPPASVDLVISTSALHHLPDLTVLQATLKRLHSVLKPEGGFYIFDFGLLKSETTRQFMVDEVAKLAMPMTVEDYTHSLRAAFPVDDVVHCAREAIPRPFTVKLSSFVDFFYFLQSEARCSSPQSTADYIDSIWRELPLSMKLEHVMLRAMRRTVKR